MSEYTCDKCKEKFYSLKETGDHAMKEKHYTFIPKYGEGKLCVV